MPKEARLSRDDWTAEALRTLGAGGLASVAIEPIAARLGATKGSGYWHFKGRADLVEATLARWEAQHTEAVIVQADTGPGPVDRLRELLRVALGRSGPFSVELALMASSDDPLVAPTVRRVTQRRLDYLRSQFRELGFDEARADRQALLTYTTYLGHAQLARTAPGAVPTGGPARAAYLESVLATLLGRETQAPPPG